MRSIASLTLLFLTACGGAPRTSVTFPAEPPPRDEAALTAAVEAYYTAENVAGMRDAVKAAAKAGPDAGLAHEIAADLALFEDRPHDALTHLTRALLDPAADAGVLYLHRLAELSWTLPERERVVGVLAAVRREHPDPETRAFAAWMLGHALHLAGDAKGRDAAVTSLDLLPLAVIGTWDNDQGKGFDAEFPPERAVELDAEYPGKLTKVGWRTDFVRDPRGKTDLAGLLAPNSWQVGYAAAAVEVAEAGAYELRLSTSDPVKVWVNQVLVFEGRRLNKWLFDGLVLPVKLRAGVNQVLVKSAQQTGVWLLVARFTGPKGAPLAPDVLRPVKADTPIADGERPAEMLDEEALLARHMLHLGTESARRDFLRAVWAEDMGLAVPAVMHAEAFVAKHPKSVRGRYLLAAALWDNQERGRTADLLAELADEVGDALLYVQLQQTRFWQQQKLDIKARKLLARLHEAHPDRPGAKLRLAESLEDEKWHEERCALLEDANARWPRWPRVMTELADCYEDLSFYPRAQRVYERLVAAMPGEGDALRNLHWLTQGNDEYEAAHRYALALVERWPHLRSSWQRLGETRRRMGDMKGAREALKQLVEIAPTWSKGYERLARLALQAGDEGRAVDLWKTALELDPENEKVANRLAWLAPDREGPWAADIPDTSALDAAVAARAQVKPADGANIVYLLDDEVTSLGHDGSTINVVTMVAHAVNQAGRDHLTRMRVRGGGRSRILHAYAVDPSGRRVEASSIRGRTVRFRQLKVGSTVVLQYRIDQRPDGYLAGHMARQWWFQGPSVQTHFGRWVLWAPKESKLLEEVVGEVKRTEVDHADQTRFEWSMRDNPPLVAEPAMPTLQEVADHVVVSTVPSWDMFWKWERALLNDAFRANPELEQLAATLFEGAADNLEKVRRVHAYLMTDIRYQQDYERRIAGVKPHAAPVVVARQYGDCKDKAVLFITLARLAGIDVEFALVRTRDAGPVRRGVPMQQFNHAIVYVPKQEGIAEGRFYDPTVDALDVDVLRQDDQGTWSLVYNPRTHEHTWRRIPYQAPDVDYVRSQTELQLDPGGSVEGEIEVTAHGQVGEGLRRGARNPEQFKQMLQRQLAQTYPGAQLEALQPVQVTDVRQPAKVRLALNSQTLGRREGDELRFKLPIGWTPARWFSLAERRHPLLLGVPRTMDWEVSMALPEGARVKRTPSTATIESACISMERTVHAGKDRVVASQKVQIRCERIPVEQYGRHRAEAEKMLRLLDEELVVDVKRSPARPSPPARKPATTAQTE